MSATNAAVIGVLNDGRQVGELSLINQLSAARVALEADGHVIIELGSGSLLATPTLESVDIVWLPLLETSSIYSSQERANLSLYVFNGGRVIWIGDADVFNTADESFLTTFGLSKQAGNFGNTLVPALPFHPAVTGPHGTVNAIGTNASYGLFDSVPEVADVFVGDPGPGTVVGLMDASSGYDGSGRAAFICDATMFGQLLLGDDHEALLRNVVKWAEAGLFYTPGGSDVVVGPLLNACGACVGLDVVFAEVAATGETSAASIGSGRCHYSGILFESLPNDFVGYGFDLQTTATLGAGTTVSMTVSYDTVALSALGIADETDLKLYHHDNGANVDVTTAVDTAAKTITGVANGTGEFLLGIMLSTQDCNGNGTPDVCEIDVTSSAPGGPFECTNDCDPDCNNNGVPDECDIQASSADCNGNGIPDECEALVNVTVTANPPDGGTVTPNGAEQYPVCTNLSIEATPEAGRCLSSWSVDTGAAPADAEAAQTTVIADENKTVTAHFVEIIVQHPTDVDVCRGDSAVLSVELRPELTVEASYEWKQDGATIADDGIVSGTTTNTLRIDPVGSEHAGDYACIVTLPCGTATSNAAFLSLRAETEIQKNPEDHFACPNDSVKFEIEATGSDLLYQWQHDAGEGFENLADGNTIDGSLTASLVLTNLDTDASGHYRCVVTGACGEPVMTDAAELTIGANTSILSNPDDATVCPGDSVTFVVTAVGTNLVYQWRFDDGNGPENLIDDGNIAGATNSTITIDDVDATYAGTYDCIVSGDCPSTTLSIPATLTVSANPQILDAPADQSACPGDTVVFAISAVGTGLVYQWQFDSGTGFADLNDSSDISGATSSALTVNNLTNSDAGAYRCVVSGNCGAPVMSEAAALVVLADVLMTSQPNEATVCPGGDVTFQVSATGTDLAYQWQFNDGPAFESLADGNGISGANTDTLTISGTNDDNVGSYHCVVTGACGPAQTSDAVSLSLSSGLCDCNDNSTPDEEDIANGTSQDCNDNGVPDDCDLDAGGHQDCNGNQVPDECEVSEANDCNGNGVPDECEQDDCNMDDIPDVCQLENNDCNGNGLLDECEPPYVADAGSDRTICTSQITLPMGGDPVASGSIPPYSYLWRLNAGPPGGGEILSPTNERARFRATLSGVYEIELLVSDSSLPPCTVTDVMTVTVYDASVDAGPNFAMCDGATSAPLAPTVTGGKGPIDYQWSIEPSSPSTDLSQFTGGGHGNASPTFTPNLPGEYTLRLTVTDSNELTCTRSDTMTINVIRLTTRVPNDFSMCVGGESAPLDVTITSPGTPPHFFNWSIDNGSPDLSPSQFGGDGPTSAGPTFMPASPGNYVLRVSVLDSSTPPCEVSTTFQLTAETMVVDAGESIAQCVGGDGIRLSPDVQGGSGNLIYDWTIETGPILDLAQFSEPHSFHATPLFVPAAQGIYTLRLTVTDSGTPPCVASDTVEIFATSMTVDAGTDFVTQAFQASQPLGASPVVSGGDPPFLYTWRVLVGPSLSSSQFSATNVANPSFTPSAVGSYALEVGVTDVNGDGCTVTDQVIVEAITAIQSLTVNPEGRLFMQLQLGKQKASGEVRLALADPGIDVTGELFDDGTSADFTGLLLLPKLTRRILLSSQPMQDAYVVVVIMRYDNTEVTPQDEASLKLQWWDGQQGTWRPATDGPIEYGAYPPRPTLSDLGRCGVDRVRNEVWSVVGYMGEFSIGISSGESPPVTAGANAPEVVGNGTPLCGTIGSGSILPLMTAFMVRKRRCRRLRTASRSV